MRVTVLGAYSMKGIAKKSGAPYEMAKLVIRAPQETMANANMQRIGFGYGVNELDLDPAAIQKFNLPYPPEGIELDLEVGSIVQYGRLQAIVVGCTVAEKPKAIKAA
ncbi:MAG: hypothetical protein QM739_04070 [Propionivibrio sp.]